MNPYFQRGDGPLVSVLVPSRGRPSLLWSSISNLCQAAADLRQIEILIRLDEDDTETLEYPLLHQLQTLPVKIGVILGLRGKGYLDLHTYYNELAAKATGDWLLLWNDDAVMLTKDWDKYVFYAQPTFDPPGSRDAFILLTRDGKFTEPVVANTSQFFVRRKVFEVLGHLALQPVVDSWLMNIFAILGRHSTWEHIVTRHDQQHGKEDPFNGQVGRILADSAKDMIKDALKLVEFIENPY